MSDRGRRGWEDLPEMWGEDDQPGDMWWLGPDLIWRRIRRPADAAAQALAGSRYFLSLGVGAEPEWAIPTPAIAILEGLGSRLGVSLGHD